MKKYKSQEPRQMDRLANGKVRYYYNEELGTETNIIPAQEEGGEPTEDTHPVHIYDTVDLDKPVTQETKGVLIDALIRTATLTIKEGNTEKQAGPYSQSDVEAIMRHKIAGDAGAAAEFRTFNLFAEACKAQAAIILGENTEE